MGAISDAAKGAWVWMGIDLALSGINLYFWLY